MSEHFPLPLHYIKTVLSCLYITTASAEHFHCTLVKVLQLTLAGTACSWSSSCLIASLQMSVAGFTRVGTLIVATIYLQLIQNRYMFRSFTALQCSHQHCVQPVASDVEVVGYL